VDASNIQVHGSKLTCYLPVQEVSPIHIEIPTEEMLPNRWNGNPSWLADHMIRTW